MFTRESLPTPKIQCTNISTVIDNVIISEDLVLQQLEKIKETKAPGPDGIFGRFLKETKCELAKPLTLIYRKFREEGTVPESWKQANVTLIFKKGSRTMVSNYRPISLTSIPCKILESIIKGQILVYLQKHDL